MGTILSARTSDHPTPLRRHGNTSAWYSPFSQTHNSNSPSVGAVAIGFQTSDEVAFSMSLGCGN
jgi:hypothetical protein